MFFVSGGSRWQDVLAEEVVWWRLLIIYIYKLSLQTPSAFRIVLVRPLLRAVPETRKNDHEVYEFIRYFAPIGRLAVHYISFHRGASHVRIAAAHISII